MISIILVLYNSKDYIYDCLNSIIDSKIMNVPHEILILNNNQNDHYELNNNKIKVIKSDSNIGYTSAINKLIQISKGDYILTINPDVILNKNTLYDMHCIIKNNKNIGVVGCRGLNTDKTLQISSRRRFPHIFTLLTRIGHSLNKTIINKYNYFDINSTDYYAVDSVSGSCMLFRRELYDKLNGFDERFFLYFEDTDFCIRSNLINYKVIYDPSSSYIHKNRGSVNKKNKYFVKFHFYLSMIKFLFKYYYEYKIFFVSLILLIIIFKTI